MAKKQHSVIPHCFIWSTYGSPLVAYLSDTTAKRPGTETAQDRKRTHKKKLTTNTKIWERDNNGKSHYVANNVNNISVVQNILTFFTFSWDRWHNNINKLFLVPIITIIILVNVKKTDFPLNIPILMALAANEHVVKRQSEISDISSRHTMGDSFQKGRAEIRSTEDSN